MWRLVSFKKFHRYFLVIEDPQTLCMGVSHPLLQGWLVISCLLNASYLQYTRKMITLWESVLTIRKQDPRTTAFVVTSRSIGTKITDKTTANNNSCTWQIPKTIIMKAFNVIFKTLGLIWTVAGNGKYHNATSPSWLRIFLYILVMRTRLLPKITLRGPLGS